MKKAPQRPVVSPDAGGALSVIPRKTNGQFAKRASDTTIQTPRKSGHDGDGTCVSPQRAASPAQLVTRVTRAIERELAQIEDIVGGERISASKRTEAEKRARTLASLARTLGEVTRLRGAANEAKPGHDDDAVPRDLDDFRRTLERRLAQMVDPPEVVPDRGDDAP